MESYNGVLVDLVDEIYELVLCDLFYKFLVFMKFESVWGYIVRDKLQLITMATQEYIPVITKTQVLFRSNIWLYFSTHRTLIFSLHF